MPGIVIASQGASGQIDRRHGRGVERIGHHGCITSRMHHIRAFARAGFPRARTSSFVLEVRNISLACPKSLHFGVHIFYLPVLPDALWWGRRRLGFCAKIPKVVVSRETAGKRLTTARGITWSRVADFVGDSIILIYFSYHILSLIRILID